MSFSSFEWCEDFKGSSEIACVTTENSQMKEMKDKSKDNCHFAEVSSLQGKLA